MTTQEILNSSLNKTQKGFKLYDLGHTRKQVSEWVTNGNYGFAHNIYKKWIDSNIEQSTAIALPFEFNFNRTFGIELEVYGVHRDTILRCLVNEGIEVYDERYNHNTRNYWKIVNDASIRGGNGSEIVSPVLIGHEGMEQVKKVCIGLQKAKAKINSSCGFHVHFGAEDFQLRNFKSLLTTYVHLEKDIDAMVPNSRRKNNSTYCKSLTSIARSKTATIARINNANTVNEMIQSVFRNRYVKVNVQSFTRQGTIEFRHHSGTTSFQKVKNWILICGRMMEWSKQNNSTNQLQSFLNESLLDYVNDRAVDLVA